MSDMRASLRLDFVDQLSQPWRKMTRQIQDSMSRVQKASKDVSKSLEGIKQASMKMRDAGASMSLKLSTPLLALGGLALRTAVNFEAAMNNVQGVTGATADQMQKLKGRAQELGATTAFSASDAAEAMGAMAQAGMDVNSIYEALPGVLNVASAGNMQLGETADMVTNMLAGFGKNVSELASVNDMLAKTATSSNTNIRMIANAMSYAAPTASAAGQSFEEVSALIGALGDAGLKGSRGGRNLGMMFNKLLNRSEKADQIFQRLGLAQQDIFTDDGGLQSMIDIIRTLDKSGASLSDYGAIFGAEVSPAILALKSKGADALDELTAKIRDAKGAAQELGDIKMQGAKGGIFGLKSAVEGLMLAFADAGPLGWFTDAVKSMTVWVRDLAKSSPGMFQFVAIFGLIIAALGPLIMALGQVGWAVYGLSFAFGAFKAMQIGALFTSIAGAVKALGAAIMTNPLGLFLAAIASSLYIIITRFDDLKKGLRAIIGFAGLGFDWILQKVRALAAAITSVLPDWLTDKLGLNVTSASGPLPGQPVATPPFEFKSAYPARRGESQAGVQAQALVGGELHIKIDSVGRPTVKALKSHNPDFGLEVDAGLVMEGGA